MSENGRVTQKQLYETLTSMEQRLMTQLGENHYQTTSLRAEVAAIAARMEDQRQEIEHLRGRSNFLDGVNAVLVVIGALLAGWLKGE